jgi:hypothetical protein
MAGVPGSSSFRLVLASLIAVAIGHSLLSHANEAPGEVRPMMKTSACNGTETFEEYRQRLGWPGGVSRSIPRAWTALENTYGSCEDCRVPQKASQLEGGRSVRHISQYHLNFILRCLLSENSNATSYAAAYTGNPQVRGTCPTKNDMLRYYSLADWGVALTNEQKEQASRNFERAQRNFGHLAQESGLIEFSDINNNREMCMLSRAVRLWQRSCYDLHSRSIGDRLRAHCPNDLDGSNRLLCEADDDIGSRESGEVNRRPGNLCDAARAGFVASRDNPRSTNRRGSAAKIDSSTPSSGVP